MQGKSYCERAPPGLEMRKEILRFRGEPKITNQENGRKVPPCMPVEEVGGKDCCGKKNNRWMWNVTHSDFLRSKR